MPSKTIHTYTIGPDAAQVQSDIEAHFNQELPTTDLTFVHASNPADLTPDTACNLFVISCKAVTPEDDDYETVMGAYREFEGASTRLPDAMFVPWTEADVMFYNSDVIGDKRNAFHRAKNFGHVCDAGNTLCVSDFLRSGKPS